MKIKPDSLIAAKSYEVSGWEDYELLDSGGYRKLERFGDHLIIRTEPAAVWKPALGLAKWEQAGAEFLIRKGQSQGAWVIEERLPLTWIINYKALKISLSITKSRHIGIFPEQQVHWEWVVKKINESGTPFSILNLFGYTGLSTLAAASAGAFVTHVDASKSSIERAKTNFDLSGLTGKPVRWIIDDVNKFVQREIRRGNRYNAIIMDPPSFGRGPKGEVWKFDKAIIALLSACKQILSENPQFLLITAYNNNYQASDLRDTIGETMHGLMGNITCGDLVQTEKSAGRKIHQAIYSKWEGKHLGML